MTIVQAYKRTKPYTHAFPDITLMFEPNERGDVVCSVPEQSAVERLLLVPTGFRVYGPAADELVSALLSLAQVPISAPQAPAEDQSPYVLKDEQDGEIVVLDLRPMSDIELHAFADANGIKVHSAAKGDKIRDKIVAFLKSEG